MENPVLEGVTFTHIRQTIRSFILPLVQAIYDENPTDILMFCSDYFNDLLQKRESDLANIDHQNLKYVDESTQKKEEGIENQHANDESKEIDDFPTNVQGSSSAPLLITNKQSMVVNLRGTSSWDTPSNLIEPIKSLAVLKDAACGIGDQFSVTKKQIGLQNDAEISDTNTYLKDDSAFEDDSPIKDKIVNEVKNYSAEEEYRNDSTEDDLKTLCTKFEGMKTSETSDTLKFYGSMRNDFDQEIAQKENVKICGKELSPNSSSGFIPCLNECDSEKKMEKGNSEGCDEDFQTKTKEINALAMKFSETFSNLADDISYSETNFNVKLQNAKEISDVIEGRNNVREVNFDIKYDQISDSRNDLIAEKDDDTLTKISDKHELDNIKDGNKTCDRKMEELSVSLEAANGNMIDDLEEKLKEDQETKRDFTKQMNSQKEKYPDKENLKTILFDDKDDNEDNDDNDDKSDHPEAQNIVDKSWRKKWYEDHPPLDNFDGVPRLRRDPRLRRVRFSDHRPNIGEAGDVSLDKSHETNGASNNWHSKNEIASESSTDFRELNYSRFFRDKISYRPIRGTVSDNSSERKISSEKISNANPQSIPYSWRKLCKQSHSSENLGKNSKASQLNEGTDIASAREEMRALNGTETKSEIDANEKGESNLEVSDEIQDQSVTEKDKIMKRIIIEGDVEEQTKNLDHNGALSEKLKDKAVNQNNGCPIKDEFGLNAACGDYVLLKSDANEHDIDSQTCRLDLEENNENYTEQNNGNNGKISKEYLEEIIGRVIEEQKNDSKDSLEGLNFPCYSESDSSYSDFSETEDFDVSDSKRDT